MAHVDVQLGQAWSAQGRLGRRSLRERSHGSAEARSADPSRSVLPL